MTGWLIELGPNYDIIIDTYLYVVIISEHLGHLLKTKSVVFMVVIQFHG